ncbi:MAG: histidine phosphatase family protein [Acidobacteria bacterium]|nr:histidine phosphatase family protein [Acidobacteriota bacterium]
MTLHLLIMRHAKSSWDHLDLDDADRPLAKRGKRNIDHMGRFLGRLEQKPEVAVCSPAKRARDTARRVLHIMGLDVSIELDNTLYMGGLEAHRLAIANLREARVNCALLVGHNPDLEELVRFLCPSGIEEMPYKKLMPTCAVAHIRLASTRGRPGAGSGELVDLYRPKTIN